MRTATPDHPHVSLPIAARDAWRGSWAAPLLVGLALIALSYATLLLPGTTVDRLVEEDGWFEWLTALSLLASSALFVVAFAELRRAGGLARVLPWTMLALGAIMFVGAGEEISWGQRIFGWSTPESLEAVNAQQETNLHNLGVFSGLTDMDRLFSLGWALLFVAVPLLAFAIPRVRRVLVRLVPVAPLWLAALFVANFLARNVAATIADGTTAWSSIYAPSSAAVEISEALTAVLIAVAAALAVGAARKRPADVP